MTDAAVRTTTTSPTSAADGIPVMTPPRLRTAEVAAAVASVLGLASATVTLGWGLGGTAGLGPAGLDSAGGAGRAVLTGTPTAVALVVAVVSAKVVAALLPGWAVSPDGSAVYPSARRRVVRALAWGEAVLLTGLGAALTVAAVLVTTGTGTVTGVDPGSVRWHAVVWNPWLLAWGLAALVAVAASRERAPEEG